MISVQAWFEAKGELKVPFLYCRLHAQNEERKHFLFLVIWVELWHCSLNHTDLSYCCERSCNSLNCVHVRFICWNFYPPVRFYWYFNIGSLGKPLRLNEVITVWKVHVRTLEKSDCWQARKRRSTRNQTHWHLDLGLQASCTVRK